MEGRFPGQFHGNLTFELGFMVYWTKLRCEIIQKLIDALSELYLSLLRPRPSNSAQKHLLKFKSSCTHKFRSKGNLYIFATSTPSQIGAHSSCI
jgi:hypothetical protein